MEISFLPNFVSRVLHIAFSKREINCMPHRITQLYPNPALVHNFSLFTVGGQQQDYHWVYYWRRDGQEDQDCPDVQSWEETGVKSYRQEKSTAKIWHVQVMPRYHGTLVDRRGSEHQSWWGFTLIHCTTNTQQSKRKMVLSKCFQIASDPLNQTGQITPWWEEGFLNLCDRVWSWCNDF